MIYSFVMRALFSLSSMACENVSLMMAISMFKNTIVIRKVANRKRI